MFTVTRYLAAHNKEVLNLKFMFLNWMGKKQHLHISELLDNKIVHSNLQYLEKWLTGNFTQEQT